MENTSEKQIRYAALGLGGLFLLLALAGFIPSWLSAPVDPAATGGFGYIFGLFPTNYFHNAIGVLVGLWGMAAFTSLSGAVTFNQIFAIVYGLQAVLGLLPFSKTLFGTMPLYGGNVVLSIIAAAIAYYFGFVKLADVNRPTTTTGTTNTVL
ncbi:MAG TPA: DUF4383 domain-containing protein [Crinalium sp.]|jgi:hypothetical protein